MIAFRISSQFLPEFMSAVTGWDVDMDEILQAGERIANIRAAFNIREGVNVVKREVPGRVIGRPQLKSGPLEDVTIDLDSMVKDYLRVMEWDPISAKPSREKLLQVGLDDVAEDLWHR